MESATVSDQQKTRPGPSRAIVAVQNVTGRHGRPVKVRLLLECGHEKIGYRSWLGTRWSYCGECGP